MEKLNEEYMEGMRMEKVIIVINTRKNINKWDFECFIEVTSKKGNTFLRELKYPASHYFDNEEELNEAIDRGSYN